MSKKGFTLVELLAVITILAILSSVATVSFLKINNDTKKKMYFEKVDQLLVDAKRYGESNKDKFTSAMSCFVEIKVSDLINEGYTKKENDNAPYITNPYSKNSMDDDTIRLYQKNKRIYVYYVPSNDSDKEVYKEHDTYKVCSDTEDEIKDACVKETRPEISCGTKVYKVTTNYNYLYHNTEWQRIGESITRSVIDGDTYIPSNIEAPTGYHAANKFEYFDTSSNKIGDGIIGSDNIIVNSDITVNVLYYPDEYAIIYNANGGVGEPKKQIKYYDTTATISSDEPTRNGYTFLGWAKTSNAHQIDYSNGQTYSDNKNLTLYAIFRKAFTVTYKDGGGVQSNFAYIYNNETSSDITLLNERQYSDNCGGSDWNHIYTNLGWSKTTNPDGLVDYNNGQTIKISSDITLYGQYVKEVKVVYSGNGGTCDRVYSDDVKHIYYNGSGNSSPGVSLEVNLDVTCTRPGYTFNKRIYCNGDKSGLKMIGGTWYLGSLFKCGVICEAGWS